MSGKTKSLNVFLNLFLCMPFSQICNATSARYYYDHFLWRSVLNLIRLGAALRYLWMKKDVSIFLNVFYRKLLIKNGSADFSKEIEVGLNACRVELYFEVVCSTMTRQPCCQTSSQLWTYFLHFCSYVRLFWS